MSVRKLVVSGDRLFELRNGLFRKVGIGIGEAKLHMDLSRVSEPGQHFGNEICRTSFIEHGQIRLRQSILIVKGRADSDGGRELVSGSIDVDNAKHYLTEKPMQLCHSQVFGILWR